MKRTDPSGPADTRLMGIVHSALRRDLSRTLTALTARPAPADEQRTAIAQHLAWMMGFLQRHHQGEDEGLYPLVRRRNPAAAALLASMDADHRRIIPAMEDVAAAARAYQHSASERLGLVEAIGALQDLLLPHLQREEQEMMPVVARSITAADWDDWDRRYNVAPLAPLELAETGLWLLDELGPEDRGVIENLVPPIPRWAILHLAAGRYRRAAFRRWLLPQHSALKFRLTGQVEATTAAEPETVWALIADVTRVGEWSHECRGADWVGGATSAAVGARFRGRNTSRGWRWNRVCTIVACEPPREFAYRTRGLLFNDATLWHFALEPSATGTRIVQTYRVLSMRVWADRLIWLAVPAHRDRRAALQADLGRLAALAAGVAADAE